MFVTASQSGVPPGAPGTPWHAVATQEVWAALGTTPEGLSEQEAAKRLANVGLNRLPLEPGVSALSILLAQLRSIVVLLLLVAVVLSLALRDVIEAGAIGAVLLINTVLGFMTEWRARRAMETLLRLQAARATVVRDEELRVVGAETLVPGDVVQLDAGNTVPADVRLFQSAELTTNEAPMTGESLPVEKTPDIAFDRTTPLADRRNMAYMGTTIATGMGLGVVVATGASTELGRIGELVRSVEEEPTPGIMQIAHLGNARSDADVLRPSRALANRYALAAVAVSLALQLATSLGPLASILGVSPLSAGQWLVVLGFAAIPAAGGQISKRVRGRRREEAV